MFSACSLDRPRRRSRSSLDSIDIPCPWASWARRDDGRCTGSARGSSSCRRSYGAGASCIQSASPHGTGASLPAKTRGIRRHDGCCRGDRHGGSHDDHRGGRPCGRCGGRHHGDRRRDGKLRRSPSRRKSRRSLSLRSSRRKSRRSLSRRKSRRSRSRRVRPYGNLGGRRCGGSCDAHHRGGNHDDRYHGAGSADSRRSRLRGNGSRLRGAA